MTVAFIDHNRAEFGVESVCAALQVAPSTYWTAKRRPRSARAVRDAELMPLLLVLWQANYSVYDPLVVLLWVWVVGPFEGFGLGVVVVDVVEDCCGEVAGVVELGGVEELSGEDGEPHLDLVEPGGVGGGAVQEHAVVAVEELLDGFGAVGGEVVDDAVQLEVRGHLGVDLAGVEGEPSSAQFRVVAVRERRVVAAEVVAGGPPDFLLFGCRIRQRDPKRSVSPSAADASSTENDT